MAVADASAGAAWPEAGIKPKSDLLIPMVVAVGSFMQGLDSTVITTAIPKMAASLGVSPLRLSVAITSYLLSLAVFTPAVRCTQPPVIVT